MKETPPFPVISRLAPTPSGFLHIGNAVNFLVTWAIVRSAEGRLILRIDDMDGIRFNPEVLEDIFTSLDWLGLDWDDGPIGPEDFFNSFSLQRRKEHYRNRLEELQAASDRVYACQCSRSKIKKISPAGLYPGTCRHADLPHIPGKTVLRLLVPSPAPIRVGDTEIDLAKQFGDFVLWRRDDQSSYQLASLIEDEEARVTLIVRGEDLLLSTAAQLYLAGCFSFDNFPNVRFIHHPLVLGDDNQKLSKSRGAHALKDIREAGGSPEQAVKMAAKILGLPGQEFFSPEDLVTALKEKEATGLEKNVSRVILS